MSAPRALVGWVVLCGLAATAHAAPVTSGDGVVVGPERLVGERRPQFSPAIGWSGDQALVVWATGGSGLVGRRVDRDAGVRGAEIVIAPEVADVWRAYDAVLPYRGGWLVSWQETSARQRRRFAAEVDATGAVAQPVALLDLTDQDSSAVALQGDAIVVVWADRVGTAQWRLRLAWLDALAPVGASVELDRMGSNPAIATAEDGTALIVWHRFRSGHQFNVVARLGADRRVLDPDGIALRETFDTLTAVAVRGGFLVSVGERVYRIERDGAVGAARSMGVLHALATAAAGGEVVAIVDADPWTGAHLGRRVQRWTADGVKRTRAPVELVRDSHMPSITATTDGRAIVAYTRSASTPDAEVVLRTLDVLPLGGACGAASDCATGHCVDGVCCAEACEGGADDCQACSVDAGSSLDGTCAPTDRTPCGDGVCVMGVCDRGDAFIDAGVDAAPDTVTDAATAADAATVADAASDTVADAATVAVTDAATPTKPRAAPEEGCGCRSSGAPGGAGLLAAALLVATRRRRVFGTIAR